MPVASFLALRSAMPLVDVRSPAEYARGHIPGAHNLPLFTDEERAVVGTLYAQEGRVPAVVRGMEFVGPRMADMTRRAMELAGDGRKVALMCRRGGMRSASVAWMLEQAELAAYCLPGGYKAYRRHVLEQFSRPWPLRMLGGMTGSGKTELLHVMRGQGSQVIDLEALAMHRGSVFGAWNGIAQPGQEQFENLLAEALSACGASCPIWVEDECVNLGTVNIPRQFFEQMQAAPLSMLEVPRAERLARLVRAYDAARNSFVAEGLRRIRKRLGDAAHDAAQSALAAGRYAQTASILLEYYDGAYRKQAARRPAPIQTVLTAAGENLHSVAARLREFA